MRLRPVSPEFEDSEIRRARVRKRLLFGNETRTMRIEEKTELHVMIAIRRCNDFISNSNWNIPLINEHVKSQTKVKSVCVQVFRVQGLKI